MINLHIIFNIVLSIQAFTTNPLIPGDTIVKEVSNEMLLAHKKYLPQFENAIRSLEIKINNIEIRIKFRLVREI